MNAGRTALVTGAGRGIRAAIAVALAAQRFRRGDLRRARRGRDRPTGAGRGRHGLAIRGDVASAADRQRVVSEVWAAFGGLEVLVNNAGMAPRERRDLLEATEESFDELIAANLKGPYFLTQHAARWMEQRGSGRIVFVTSISAYTASVNRGEYCISKAGLSMAVALYAERLAAAGIQVFEIRPGIIRTDMIAGVTKKYED